MYSILGLIVRYKISLRVCVLVVLTNPNLAKNFNMSEQIEISDSLNYFDQSMILINYLKIETSVFHARQALTKENEGTIEITCFNH